MSSVNYISANTGQLIRLVVQTVDGYGGRADGYVPIVTEVIYPDLSKALGYPREMTKIGTGLYASGLLLEEGIDALGTYVASVFWIENGVQKWETFAVNAGRPFGISTVTPI